MKCSVMVISKETFSRIISIFLGLTSLVLFILYFVTDVIISDTILFGYIAVMTSLRGFRKIKAKKYTGYLYFLYTVIWFLGVVKNLVESY